MQLEFFDIRSNDIPPKGKAPALAGGPFKTLQGGETNTDKSTGNADFMASLALVSTENQDSRGRIQMTASGSDQLADDADADLLGDILKEIMREWPAGKRPTLLPGTGGEVRGSSRPDSGAEKTGRGPGTRSSSDQGLSGAGKKAPAMTLARQGTAGFTGGLIKHMNNAQKTDVALTGAENELKTAVMATVSAQGNGQKVAAGVLAGDDARQPEGNPSPVKGALVRGGKGNNTGNDKNAGELTGQLADVLKTSRKAAPERVSFLKTAAKSLEKGNEKNASVKIEAGTVPAAAAKGKRPLESGLSENKAAGPTPSKGQNSAGSLPETAVAATPLEKGSRDGETGLKLQTAPAPPVRGRAAASVSIADKPAGDLPRDTWQSTGKQSENGLDVPLPEKSPGRRQGRVEKDSRFRNAAVSREQTAADGEKSAAAVERKVLLSQGANAADKERTGITHPAGQTVSEPRGGEDSRFEMPAARVKPMENAPLPPTGQPGPSGAAPLDSEKPYMDRALQARVMGQIAERVRVLPKRGGNEIRINLRPETLGQVQLKVLTQDHSVAVKMVADTHAAKEIIENNLGQLRADLNALGLNVDRLDVDVFTANDPGEREAAEHRGSFNKDAAGTGESPEEAGDLADRVRQMQAAEDAADGSKLIGVFA